MTPIAGSTYRVNSGHGSFKMRVTAVDAVSATGKIMEKDDTNIMRLFPIGTIRVRLCNASFNRP